MKLEEFETHNVNIASAIVLHRFKTILTFIFSAKSFHKNRKN